MIGDYFTKWTQAHALPDHTAQTVANVVVKEWICKLGVLRIIHSDQGSDFESNLFQEMCRLLDIDKTKKGGTGKFPEIQRCWSSV